MTISPVRAELFHADGRTDFRKDRHDEANSRFSQFWERAKLIYCIKIQFVTYWEHIMQTLERIFTEVAVVCCTNHKKNTC
jgi:hypothetical protein